MAIKKKYNQQKTRLRKYLKSRIHRSFRRTRRRDYIRPLELPGYISFTNYTVKIIWSNRRIFISLAILYGALTVLLVGIASQDLYNSIYTTLDDTSGTFFSGSFGEIGKAGLLFLTSSTGGISQSLNEAQQVYAGLILLLTWMTTIWLLRNILARNKLKMRDGLYNAGSPIISTVVVALVFMIQLLPLGLGLIAYAAAAQTGLLSGGVESMLFWIAFGLLALLSVYWVTSTFFALVIVTLPGVYPMQAIKTANDLMLGRRFRMLLRLVWLFFVSVLAWAIIMIPIILIDIWVKSLWEGISWFPTVPLALLVLGAITTIWVSGYIYLLYRKVVTNETDAT